MLSPQHKRAFQEDTLMSALTAQCTKLSYVVTHNQQPDNNIHRCCTWRLYSNAIQQSYLKIYLFLITSLTSTNVCHAHIATCYLTLKFSKSPSAHRATTLSHQFRPWGVYCCRLDCLELTARLSL